MSRSKDDKTHVYSRRSNTDVDQRDDAQDDGTQFGGGDDGTQFGGGDDGTFTSQANEQDAGESAVDTEAAPVREDGGGETGDESKTRKHMTLSIQVSNRLTRTGYIWLILGLVIIIISSFIAIWSASPSPPRITSRGCGSLGSMVENRISDPSGFHCIETWENC
ncbi:Uncharacterized protein Fot_53898 [Forsythia ovata]|uniref:Uncharacterized protein n=1 Tax=Forsythia ovata TaxID=205694 RepID=A0ABD1PFH4_9LAMI